jgi:hypothetical protein
VSLVRDSRVHVLLLVVVGLLVAWAVETLVALALFAVAVLKDRRRGGEDGDRS